MTDKPQRQEGQGRIVTALDMAITGLNIVNEATSTTLVNPGLGSVAVLLTVIRMSFLPFCDELPEAHK